MNRRSRSILAMLIVIGTLAPAACKRKDATPPPPPPPKVVVAPVTQQTVPLVLEFSSTLQSIKTVQFIPRVSGYIMERDFVEGAHVEKGELLYQIDPRPFEAQLDQYQAQLESDQAEKNFQDSELERAKEAFEQKALSENELLQYTAQAKEAAAAVAATQATIEGTKLDLEYARIMAPFDGHIQDTLINVGNLVTAEKSVLTTLVQIDPIYAVFNVSRNQLDRIETMIHQGLVAGASGPDTWKAFKVKLLLPDGSEYEHEGELNFVAAQINPNTDMLMARAIFENPGDGDHGVVLVPGQFSRVRLILGERPDALLVPERSIVQTQAGTQVYVVTSANKVEARKVELGMKFGHLHLVEKGVNAGEQVIVGGTQKVRDGMAVDPSGAADGDGS